MKSKIKFDLYGQKGLFLIFPKVSLFNLILEYVGYVPRENNTKITTNNVFLVLETIFNIFFFKLSIL